MIEALYIGLLIFTVFMLITYIMDGRKLLETVFFAVFIIYYIYTPTILGLYGEDYAVEEYKTPYLIIVRDASDLDKYRAFFITFVVTILLIVLRKVRFNVGKDRKIIKEDLFEHESDKIIYLDNAIFKLGLFFLVIGGFALLELIVELGGLHQMLSLGNMIRGYRVDNAEYLSPVGSICKTLSVFVTGSFFCFYSAGLQHKKYRLLVISSLVLSLTYLLFNAGRGPLLLFLGCILFSILKEHGRKMIWIVVLAFIVIALLSSSIEVVMNNIAKGMPAFYHLEYSMTDNLLSTVTDLAFPYSNLLVLPKMITQSGYNYGLDYIFWFSEVIPKRLLSFLWNLLPTRILVTTKVSQFYIMSSLSYGGTPADFITYGWFQGNYIGLFLNCLIYDNIIKAIDEPLAVLPKQYSILRYRMCFFIYSLITSNDLPLMIKNNLFLFIIMIVIYIVIKRSDGIAYENR